MFSKLKKFLLVATLIIFTSVTFLFAAPKPAKAFVFGTIEQPGPLMWHFVTEKIQKNIGVMIMEASSLAIVNAVTYFFQKMAADTAVYIASGGAGQKPLFDNKSFGDYFETTALDSAMVAMDTLNDKTFGKLIGFDICQPRLPSLMLKIKTGFGFQNQLYPTPPRCDWNNFVSTWEKFGSSLNTKTVLSNFGLMFEPGQNDLGIAFEINTRLMAGVDVKVKTAMDEKTKKGPWKDVKDIITGKITTPAEEIEAGFDMYYRKIPLKQQEWQFSMLKDALLEGGKQIIPTILSTFATTLINTGLQQLTSKIFTLGDLIDNDSQQINRGSASVLAGGRRKVEGVVNDFFKPRIITSSNYDPLSEFIVCPDREDERQVSNCVLDDSFAAAVRLAEQGKPLTVAQAIEQGYLDGAKPLISSIDVRNGQNDCYQKGYCYSNLVKLRNARILPVGWELAAELNATGAPADLRTIVAGFNSCDPATNGRDNRSHKWCHMIDPNWVLRLPKTQCMAKVYGPTLVSAAGSLRAEICADPITCLSQDESGNCTGGFGYCTKEKNIWRISADKCSEQFNTCLTYKARDNKVSSYLKNTVEFGACDATNAGCRPYSNNQKFGVWSLAAGDAVYFNKNVEKCDASNAGCTEFYSKEGGLAYNLLPNPSFEKAGAAANTVAGWSGAILQVSADGTNSFDGAAAVNPAGNLQMSSPAVIKLELNTPYTLSGYVKSSLAGGITQYRLAMLLYTDPSATVIFNPSNIISTCKIGADNAMEKTGDAADAYSRASCAFLTPNMVLYAKMLIGGNSWVDAVQLEEGRDPSAFLASGYGSVNAVYIKAAPKYLDCQAGSIDPQCAKYAPVCRADEVGCERYTPKDGGPASPSQGGPSITGVANINDICPESCAGYETYKQDKTLFESEKFPNYFIPATAKSCAAPDAGCDEFTNLATEAKEYFSFIRQCIKLEPKDQWDAFYTWEGSDTTGYQLRAHRLKVGAALPGETSPVPAFVPSSVANPNPCDKTVFTAPIGSANHNPDCREFYNAAGKISYRLLSKTIIAADECVEYRKTESTEADCTASGGVWNSGAQYCIYKGYKAESRVCGAAANKCRAYNGAAASNLRIVSQDDFESGDGGWKGGTVSSEALSAGGHSLKAAGSINKSMTGLVSPNSFYNLIFWAKGTGGEKLSIGITGANIVSATLKGDWQYYEFGPIITGATGADPQLTIALSGKGFYLDNVILKEVSQKLYLIKDSWTTPGECDQTRNGLVLPQAMLGCKAYNNRSNGTIYLKSFGSLCRDEAVGCEAFKDTKNSASDKNEIWNAICSRQDTKGGDCLYKNEAVCSVGAGRSLCRFKIVDGTMPAATYRQSGYKDFSDFEIAVRKDAAMHSADIIARDESTVEVPADETVYLVNDKKYQCAERDMGCAVLGQTDLYTGLNATPVYYKNKPGEYSKILCTAEAEGCEEWTSDKGVDYFKVPRRTCEYKDASTGETGGWYKSGKSEACYGGFIKNGGYGIWRNADDNYDGSIGMCPAGQNACTEFIDPWDVSGTNKIGAPYYLIDNDRLKALENDQSCHGQASVIEGCVLFNRTSDIILKWTALPTYAQSDKEKKTVAPLRTACGISPPFGPLYADPLKPCIADGDCPGANTPVFPLLPQPFYTGECVRIPPDSNTILKVTRDRECGEWLACKTTYSSTNPFTGDTKLVCSELGLCNKVQVGSGGSALCANFIVNNPDSGKVLNADIYSKRDTTWVGRDYSGYSMGGKVPVTDVVFQNIGSETKPDVRMFGKSGTAPVSKAYYDLNLSEVAGVAAEKSACRAYPEQDAPFPASVGRYDTGGALAAVERSGYQDVNICEHEKDCECDYTKLTYGSSAIKKYTAHGDRNVLSGICQGGPRDGLGCQTGILFEEDPLHACGAPELGGTCLALKRQDDVIGWQGYCLERDLSTSINGNMTQKACVTWLPQDIAPGQRDIYNQFRDAGYVSPFGGGKYYCLMAEGRFEEASKNPYDHYDNFLKVSPPSPSICYINGDSVEQYAICGTNEAPSIPGIYNDQKKTIGLYTVKGSQAIKTFLPSNMSDITEDQIDLIRIKSLMQEGGHADLNTVFYIRKNKTTNYSGFFKEYCDGKETIDNCRGEETEGGLTNPHAAKTFTMTDKEYNRWYYRYDDGNENGGPKRDYLVKDMFDFADAHNGNDTKDFGIFCDNGNEQQQDAAALRFNFRKTDGKLDSIDAAICSSGDEGYNYNFSELEISFRLREICNRIVDVAATKNRANTQALWQYNKKSVVSSPYKYEYEIAPYGSASSDAAPGEATNWYSYWSVGQKSFAGVPWGCFGMCGTAQTTDGDIEKLDFDFNASNSAVSKSTVSSAVSRLSGLFGKSYATYTWDVSGDGLGYNRYECTGPDSQGCWETSGNSGLKPEIYSFNPDAKLDNGQFVLAAKNRVVINNKTGGNVAINGNQYLATVRFYFWANSEYMPVKSIKVVWDDGSDGLVEDSSVTETTDGLYKNHKPRCAASNTDIPDHCLGTGEIVCKKDIECPGIAGRPPDCIDTPTEERMFGNNPDACSEEYFELSHVYTCQSGSCSFIPKVTVTDNWGLVSDPATYNGTITINTGTAGGGGAGETAPIL